MLERALISPDDVLAAARYRLRGWSTEQVADGLEALRADDGARGIPEDGRDPFSAACALLALLANAQGDAVLFWRSGYGVIDSYRQAQRSTGKRRSDALSELIRNYLDELPDISPKELWDDFTGQAIEGHHETLTGYDEAAKVLTYEPSPGAKFTDITFDAFRRRLQIFRREVRD